MYRILLKATACVQPVSCDEAYLDVTGLGDPQDVASSIRQQIFEATGCTASAGIGPSMLIARLATKKGKPNGHYRIHPHEVSKSVHEIMATGHAASAGCLLNGFGLPSQNNVSSEIHLHQQAHLVWCSHNGFNSALWVCLFQPIPISDVG